MTAQKRPSALEDLEDRICYAAWARKVQRDRLIAVMPYAFPDPTTVALEWACAPCGTTHTVAVSPVTGQRNGLIGSTHTIHLGDGPIDLRCPRDRQGWRPFA